MTIRFAPYAGEICLVVLEATATHDITIECADSSVTTERVSFWPGRFVDPTCLSDMHSGWLRYRPSEGGRHEA
jgi:hypothetical protein